MSREASEKWLRTEPKRYSGPPDGWTEMQKEDDRCVWQAATAAAKSAIPTEQVKAWDSEARATAAAIPTVKDSLLVQQRVSAAYNFARHTQIYLEEDDSSNALIGINEVVAILEALMSQFPPETNP